MVVVKETKTKYSNYYVTCDVGGTFTRIGLVGIINDQPELLALETTGTDNTLQKKIQHFLNEIPIKVKSIAIAAAGPTTGKKITLTNNKLIIDKAKYEKILNKKILLLNDYEATANLVRTYNPNYPTLLVGIGTGLGTSIITEHDIISSEAGHLKIPGENKYTKGKTFESILSAKGIERIHRSKTKKTKNAIDIKNKSIYLTLSKVLSQYLEELSKVTEAKSIFLTGGVIQRHPYMLKEIKIPKSKFIPEQDEIVLLERDAVGVLGAAMALHTAKFK